MLLLAAIAAVVIGWQSRGGLTPDGVAYLENAERFASGAWRSALQGYWSPGLSLLLVPVVWLTAPDRAALLTGAHVVQAALLGVALVRAWRIVRRRVAPSLQVPLFAIAAYILVRWVAQELVTPDLLLCVCVLTALDAAAAAAPAAAGRRVGLWMGLAFLAKTSVLPSILVAGLLASAGMVRGRIPRVTVLHAVATAAAIIGSLLLVLSVRAGKPSLGSVGPLNLAWYWGDVSRRTPDEDRGPHPAVRWLDVPGRQPLRYVDLRADPTRTYAPWSDPEGWAAGVPVDSRPTFSWEQVRDTWSANGTLLAKALGRLALPLVILGWLCWPDRRRWWRLSPAQLTGFATVGIFALLHTELRLIAPGVLLLLLGRPQQRGPDAAPWRRRSRVAAALVVGALAVQVVSFIRQMKPPESRAVLNAFVATEAARIGKPGVVVFGAGTPWMSVLWLHHLRVVAQIAPPEAEEVRKWTAHEIITTIRGAFGDDAIGVAETHSSAGAAGAVTVTEFFPWW